MNSSQRRVAVRAFRRAWPVGTRVGTRYGPGTVAKLYPSRSQYNGFVRVRRDDGSSLGIYHPNDLEKRP